MTEADRISGVRLRGTDVTGPGALALVPFRQISARGLECHDDATPLQVLEVERVHRIDTDELLAALPDIPITLTGAVFNLDDNACAAVVDRIAREPRGPGTGPGRRGGAEPDQRHLPPSGDRPGPGRAVREVLSRTMFAATVTGSPLESACRVIRHYEPSGRGYYARALALFGNDADGSLPPAGSPHPDPHDGHRARRDAADARGRDAGA
ncbi:chorismate-binding protein [Streptomyces sp. NBC_00893]|uniref:chorismate-binding protein n=1 Tax=Streptomyces sp. NBC_00893 TaxID=2975862 RepID=UPI00224C8C5E|nr:chorismate-binding protein [Streptomyces sp. NBC_00893]MCX4843777.1 chorismate-binding protein [Streptomyces sp. NBC_00893]